MSPPTKEVEMSPVDEYVTRAAENLERMGKMNLTDHEAQLVAGFLAGSEDMSDALDTVDRHREGRGN